MREKTYIKKNLYFGSIRFFRHVIYACLLLLVLSPYICIIIFYGQNRALRTEIRSLTSKLQVHAPYSGECADDKLRRIVPSLGYQSKYPNLYCDPQTAFVKKEKTVYLTFDDGPSRLTNKFLDVLKKHNIKATFFVVGKADPKSKAIMKRIVDEGHTIAPHTYSHMYNKVYASVDAFLDDFRQIHDLIYEATGVKATILRFPGGTVNVYNRRIFRELSAEMLRRGYTFFDWDVSAGDATKDATAKSVFRNITAHVRDDSRNIVLMHDTSEKSLASLDRVITTLTKSGFVFDRLTNEVAPVTFYYNHLKKGEG